MITTGNDALMEEREFIMISIDADDLEITDTGLGMGQADVCYEREAGDRGERRRVSIRITVEED